MDERLTWLFSTGRLNASGRGEGDRIIALDIDKPIGAGFEYREIPTPDYTGTNGDGRLHLVGLSGIDREDNTVDLFLVNNRPSINATTGSLADQAQVGGNSTIESFRINSQAETVQHVKTFADEQIATPNNIAANADGSFYFTNDHGLHRAGWRHDYSPTLKDGNVGFCSASGECKSVAGGYAFPNGLAFGADGLLYVPSTAGGNVVVYEPGKISGALTKVDTVKITYPLDNLNLDANGDLWVPGLPKLHQTLATFNDPMGAADPPSTIFRIRKRRALPGPGDDEGGYEVEKVLEDSEGAVLPGATVAVHDVKTGRLFVGGVVSPFISVCERKAVSSDEEIGQVGHGEL